MAASEAVDLRGEISGDDHRHDRHDDVPEQAQSHPGCRVDRARCNDKDRQRCDAQMDDAEGANASRTTEKWFVLTNAGHAGNSAGPS